MISSTLNTPATDKEAGGLNITLKHEGKEGFINTQWPRLAPSPHTWWVLRYLRSPANAHYAHLHQALSAPDWWWKENLGWVSVKREGEERKWLREHWNWEKKGQNEECRAGLLVNIRSCVFWEGKQKGFFLSLSRFRGLQKQIYHRRCLAIWIFQ